LRRNQGSQGGGAGANGNAMYWRPSGDTQPM
jgi:hypothetical protein